MDGEVYIKESNIDHTHLARPLDVDERRVIQAAVLMLKANNHVGSLDSLDGCSIDGNRFRQALIV
jgi:hypothetical protein